MILLSLVKARVPCEGILRLKLSASDNASGLKIFPKLPTINDLYHNPIIIDSSKTTEGMKKSTTVIMDFGFGKRNLQKSIWLGRNHNGKVGIVS